ncbi:MAG: epoxyqueuosine reductase [Lachnospiraceae bacterium]|nr:epoxyqueuosine reductase [Lachnospiraceae bacterium]
MIISKLQQIFTDYPEVLYGYTDISYSPFAKEYQSALVFAVPYEPQLAFDDYTEQGFEDSIRNARRELDEILRKLEAVFSFKYAAVNAGLGWIGKNDVLVTERYGPRVRLSAVLIDAPFVYGSKMTESRCPEGCTKCVDICPHKALTGRAWDIHSLRSELIDYHLCNRKRSDYIEKHGRKNACGLCMVVCPYGMKGLSAPQMLDSAEGRQTNTNKKGASSILKRL